MKKVLLVLAAAGAAAYVSSRYKSEAAGQDLWKQASDQPQARTTPGPSTSS